MRPGEPGPRPRWLLGVALVAGAFGIATVVSGGRVLFGPDSARAAAGRVVPFVLWFSFLAGFAYLAAAAGLAEVARARAVTPAWPTRAGLPPPSGRRPGRRDGAPP